MDNIFLSASVPYLGNGKDPVYHDTADFIAIREAVLGAATAILPDSCLVWGGHPSITYLIRELYKAIIGTDDDEKIRFLSKEHTHNDESASECDAWNEASIEELTDRYAAASCKCVDNHVM